MNLIGNTTGELTRKIGTTRRGEPVYDDRAERVRIDIIHLRARIEPTSVRTDSSATRGNAEEQVADAKILFRVQAKPGRGDRLIVAGQKLRIEGVEPRLDFAGKLDHFEATLVLWDDEEDAA